VDALDVVEAQMITIFRRGNNTKVVAEGVLLQELLRKILQISLGERDVRRHSDFGVT